RASRSREALRDLIRGRGKQTVGVGGFGGESRNVSLAGGARRQFGRREWSAIGSGAAAAAFAAARRRTGRHNRRCADRRHTAYRTGNGPVLSAAAGGRCLGRG